MEVRNKTNVDLHKSLCERIHSVYEAKNKDYGDSFSSPVPGGIGGAGS